MGERGRDHASEALREEKRAESSELGLRIRKLKNGGHNRSFSTNPVVLYKHLHPSTLAPTPHLRMRRNLFALREVNTPGIEALSSTCAVDDVNDASVCI